MKEGEPGGRKAGLWGSGARLFSLAGHCFCPASEASQRQVPKIFPAPLSPVASKPSPQLPNSCILANLRTLSLPQQLLKRAKKIKSCCCEFLTAVDSAAAQPFPGPCCSQDKYKWTSNSVAVGGIHAYASAVLMSMLYCFSLSCDTLMVPSESNVNAPLPRCVLTISLYWSGAAMVMPWPSDREFWPHLHLQNQLS